MGFGLPDDPLEAAALATDAGLSGIWRGGSMSDAFVPLTLAARHDRRLRVASSITAAFAHNPLTLAQQVWSAAAATDGRFVLGLGAQTPHIVRTRYGTDGTQPVRRMREYVIALRTLFASWQAGEAAVFDGAFYRLDTRGMPTPKPLATSGIPPVHLAAVGDRMAATAGELAEGVLLSGLTTKYLHERMLPAIRSGIDTAGRARRDVELLLSCIVVTGDTPNEVDAARPAARRYVSHITAKPTYRALYELHGWHDEMDRMEALIGNHDTARLADVVTDEMLDELALVGTVDQIGGMIVDRYATLLDGVGLCFAAGGTRAHHRRIVDDVRAASDTMRERSNT